MDIITRLRSGRSVLFLFSILSIILFITFLFSFTVGRYSDANFLEAFKILFNLIFGDVFPQTWSNLSVSVILNYRLPRILAAILVGAALPMAGATYQALFANPMASPDTLGVSNGAAVGAVIGILLGLGAFAVEGIAFAVGCISVAAVYFISVTISKGKNMILYLILVGMVISSLLSAIISILKYCCDPENQLPAVTYWLMGSFNSVTIEDVIVFAILFLIGATPLFLLRWRMNILSLSDVEAKTMGENTFVLRSISILCATLLTASSIAITGGIGWVGLIIPHIARIMVGQDFKKVLPISAVLGSIFLLIADNLSRTLLAVEIPIGILTSIIGAPIFFMILLKYKRNMLNDA